MCKLFIFFFLGLNIEYLLNKSWIILKTYYSTGQTLKLGRNLPIEKLVTENKWIDEKKQTHYKTNIISRYIASFKI